MHVLYSQKNNLVSLAWGQGANFLVLRIPYIFNNERHKHIMFKDCALSMSTDTENWSPATHGTSLLMLLHFSCALDSLIIKYIPHVRNEHVCPRLATGHPELLPGVSVLVSANAWIGWIFLIYPTPPNLEKQSWILNLTVFLRYCSKKRGEKNGIQFCSYSFQHIKGAKVWWK